MKYIQETNTISMAPNTTPGSLPKDSFSRYMYQKYGIRPSGEEYDMNDACVPQSKEEGGNLKKIEANIQDRFCLNERSDLVNKTGGESY